MAFLLPENLPSRSDVPQAVRDMAAVLRDHLGDDSTVWLDHEDDQPFLIVFKPQCGIVLIHVVEGGARGLEAKARKILKSNKITTFDELSGHLSGVYSGIEDRVRSVGKALAVQIAVAAPAVPKANATKIGLSDPDRYLLKEDCGPGAIDAALQRITGTAGLQLSDLDERKTRAAIYPELVIRSDSQPTEGLLFTGPADENTIAVLDREQERLARHLGDGYRVIKGVAGSGKTLVLSFRAKFLSELFPNRSILLACYNRPLADSLSHDLKDWPNITVKTVDGIAYQICRSSGVTIDGSGEESFRQQRIRATKLIKSGNLPKLRFDYVLLDEAQDLDDEATQFVHALLRRGQKDFVIALDAAQNIYKRTSRWTPDGVSGRGRTTIMKLNYRNTRDILEVAHDFLLAGQQVPTANVDLDDPTAIIPPEASPRRGERPRLVDCADERAALDLICKDIKQAHANGTAWKDMAVMFGNAGVRKRMYFAAKENGIPWFDLNYGKNKSKLAQAKDQVRGSTLQSLKGLEFERVYITGVNDIQAGRDADDETRRRLLYVGMTRATDNLTVAIYGDGPMVKPLKKAAGKA